jgi:hypothetical protein
VEERNGNIMFTDSTGHSRQLTSSGKDYTPFLSPDKRTVVFARKRLEAPYPNQPSEMEILKSELWLVDIGGKEAPRPIFQGAVIPPDGRKLQSFSGPQLSPDGRYCYFLAEYAATSHALCRLDMRTQRAVLISGALEFALVPSGPWRGYPVANVRTSERDPSIGDDNEYPNYPWFLLSPTGRKIKRVGEQRDRLYAVMARVLQLSRP